VLREASQVSTAGEAGAGRSRADATAGRRRTAHQAAVPHGHPPGAIVERTAAPAHALGLRLVAEGVEDDETGEVLARLGCDIARGHAVARPPMPVADFLRWLEQPLHPFLDRTPLP